MMPAAPLGGCERARSRRARRLPASPGTLAAPRKPTDASPPPLSGNQVPLPPGQSPRQPQGSHYRCSSRLRPLRRSVSRPLDPVTQPGACNPSHITRSPILAIPGLPAREEMALEKPKNRYSGRGRPGSVFRRKSRSEVKGFDGIGAEPVVHRLQGEIG